MADIPACGAPHPGVQVFYTAAGAQSICWQVQLMISTFGTLADGDLMLNSLRKSNAVCHASWSQSLSLIH